MGRERAARDALQSGFLTVKLIECDRCADLVHVPPAYAKPVYTCTQCREALAIARRFRRDDEARTRRSGRLVFTYRVKEQ